VKAWTIGGRLVVDSQGRVILCDACPCPPECCLYPAFGLNVYYTEDDLPSDININGVSIPKTGTDYGDTTNGVILEDEVWAVYISSIRTERNCLIYGVIEDQFSDVYTAEMIVDGIPLNIEMTRTSLCVWEGSNSTYDPFTLRVEYGNVGFPYSWRGFFQPVDDYYYKLNEDTSDANNSTPSTPDGQYYNGPNWVFSGGQEWNGTFTML
jgi:hypothetical protein